MNVKTRWSGAVGSVVVIAVVAATGLRVNRWGPAWAEAQASEAPLRGQLDVLTADDAEGRMLEQGRLDQAITHRRGLVQKAKDRKDHLALHQHLRFLMQLQAAAGNWEAVLEAGQEFEPARVRSGAAGPSDAIDDLFLAEACRRLGRYEDAIRHADQAKRKREAFLKSLTVKGPLEAQQRTTLELGALKAYCLYMLGRKDEATAVYREHKQVVMGVPKDSEPVLYLASFEPADLMFMDAELLEFKAGLARDFTFTLGRQALESLRQAKALGAQGPLSKELKDNIDRMEMTMAGLVPRWERAVRSMAPWYLGHAKFIRNDVSGAKQAFEQWVADPASRSELNKLWLACDRLGACCEKMNEVGAGIEHYRTAVEVLEQQRSFLCRDEYKLRFMLGRDRPYDRLVMLLLDRQEVGKSFETAERAKARALLDLLEARGTGRTSESRSLFAEVIRLGRLAQADPSRVPVDSRGTPKVIDFQALRANNEQEMTQTMARFDQTDPELLSMVNSRVLAYAEIAKLLPKDAILLEYYLTKDRGCVFRGEGGVLSAKPIDQPEAAIEDLVVKLRTRILAGDPDVEPIGTSLYDLLLRDVVGQSRDKGLYIVPHGPLHYLPFAALHDGKEYVVQTHAITVLPSASALKYCVAKRQGSWDSVLAMGNPKLPQSGFDLPAAELEVKAIAPMFRKAVTLIGPKATETAFVQQAGKNAILHLACHGRFDPDQPNQSGLLLVPDKQNDGYLRAAEFFGLSLKASLVTLSACETGLGRLSAGDDVVGLARAILYAGSPAILSTLWSVDDVATSDFMKAFYGSLQAGRGKAESVRRAQLTLRRRSGGTTIRRGTVLAKPGDRGKTINYSHPYFWGPFVLIGDGE